MTPQEYYWQLVRKHGVQAYVSTDLSPRLTTEALKLIARMGLSLTEADAHVLLKKVAEKGWQPILDDLMEDIFHALPAQDKLKFADRIFAGGFPTVRSGTLF